MRATVREIVVPDVAAAMVTGQLRATAQRANTSLQDPTHLFAPDAATATTSHCLTTWASGFSMDIECVGSAESFVTLSQPWSTTAAVSSLQRLLASAQRSGWRVTPGSNNETGLEDDPAVTDYGFYISVDKQFGDATCTLIVNYRGPQAGGGTSGYVAVDCARQLHI